MGRGASRIPAVPVPAPAIAPPRPHDTQLDTQPIEIRVLPSSTDSMKAVIEMEGRIVSVGDLIARIDAGKRRDVVATVSGATRHGAWSEIREALKFAGIRIGLRQPLASPIPSA